MALISNIIVKIGANTKALRSGISKANKLVSDFSKRVAKVGAAITAGITAIGVGAFALLSKVIINTANDLDRLIKTADNLGITVASFQKLAFQARQSGISTEELTVSMRQLLRVTGEAANGSKRAVAAFQSLGISLKSVQNLKPDELFLKVGKALNNMQGRAEQADTANALFGRNWLNILNLIRSDLGATEAQFNKLNLAITQGQRKQIEGFNDARERLGDFADSFKNQLTASTSQAFKVLIEGIETAIIEFGGMKEIADSASKFIVSGVVNIAEAAIFAIESVNGLSEAFQQLSSGNFGRKLAFGLATVQKTLLEISGRQFRDTFDFDTGKAIRVYSDEYKEVSKTLELLAADIVKTDDKIAASVSKRRKELDAFKDRIRQVTTAVAATQNESFIQPIGDAFANTPGPRQLVTDKSLKELEEAQNKRNKKTDEWKQKLKAANEELKKSQQTVQALQQAQENLVKSATFGGAIASLSKLTSQAATAQRGTGEREGLNRLLTAGFNKFQQFDPNNLGGQQQQKIEITITSDEAGIITPVVKSQQLNEQVVTIITKTMNNQARVNDR